MVFASNFTRFRKYKYVVERLKDKGKSTMNKIHNTIIAISIAAIGSVAFGQTTVPVTATVVSALSMTKQVDVGFGNILTGGSDAVLNKSGVQTNAGVGGSAVTVGRVSISGAGSSTVTVTQSATTYALKTSGGATLTFTPSYSGLAGTGTAGSGSSDLTITTNTVNATLDASGDYQLFVHGSLGTISSATAGAYSTANSGGAPVSLTVAYQ